MSSGGRMTVKLAVVQVRSEPGQAQANRQHATPLVEQAAAQGAGLVVLPELFSCGYVANRAIWEMGEARASLAKTTREPISG